MVSENVYAQASGTMQSVFSYFTSRYPVFGDDVEITRETLLQIPPEMTTGTSTEASSASGHEKEPRPRPGLSRWDGIEGSSS